MSAARAAQARKGRGRAARLIISTTTQDEIISNTTQDESPNELINPEILMNNHHKRTYSFTLILPAITPDTLYPLVPV